MKLTPEIIEALEAYWGKPSIRDPLAHFAEATFALIAEWRARQEPATELICLHCHKPKRAHNGHRLYCHLAGYQGQNTFSAHEPATKP